MSELWLTKQELAQWLRVSVRTVDRLDLPYTRVGGQNRYMRSEVMAELRARQAQRERRSMENVVPIRPEVVA